ncbi:hypothetical protein MTBBW1_1300024 [Desulfamplus magnetovallimortis]|uniref:Uncharacterized protein n=1 Tax=Desulfamplus magnetovallimortis TaxID=1246637 RepID=A0A1W1H776_9BACT|nr:hypothetical protein MTBBW1_1300024 [Desulfamplus magnetovallimortis]
MADTHHNLRIESHFKNKQLWRLSNNKKLAKPIQRGSYVSGNIDS